MIINNEINFESLSESSLTAKVTMILLTCVMLFVAIYLFDLKNLRSSISAQSEKEKGLKHSLLQRQQSLSQLPSQNFKDYSLPAQTQITSLIKSIPEQAHQSGLKVESFKILTKKEQGFLEERPVRVFLSGNHHDLIIFLDKLISKTPWLSISNFSIESNKQNLCKQLKMVGMLTEKNRNLALVIAPNGVVYQLSQGNCIGTYPVRILQIEQKKMQIVNMQNQLNLKLSLLFYQQKTEG